MGSLESQVTGLGKVSGRKHSTSVQMLGPGRCYLLSPESHHLLLAFRHYQENARYNPNILQECAALIGKENTGRIWTNVLSGRIINSFYFLPYLDCLESVPSGTLPL